MTGNPTYFSLHISLQDFNMSLFKERAVNARKLISLENTILSLRKQILELKGQPADLKAVEELAFLRQENDALKAEVASLKEELSAAKAPPAPKRRGRRKTPKAEVSNEQKSET